MMIFRRAAVLLLLLMIICAGIWAAQSKSKPQKKKKAKTATSAKARHIPAPHNHGLPTVKAGLDRLMTDEALAHGDVGFCLRELGTGEVMLSHDAGRSLTPASTMKIVTTATALKLLGKDFRFKTMLEYTGTISTADSTLHGNILIRGGGDPTFGKKRVEGTADFTDIFQQWALALQSAGISHVDGAVVADATYFEPEMQAEDWAWSDMGNYYGAGASGLSIYEDMFLLNLKASDTAGGPVTLASIYPDIQGLNIDLSKMTTSQRGSDDDCYVFGAPYSAQRYVIGTLAAHKPVPAIKASMPDPPLFAAQAFTTALFKNRISCTQKPFSLTQPSDWKKVDTSAKKTVLVYYSPPLSDIIKHTNHKSINLYAEHLLKAMGKLKYGLGSTDNGLNAVKTFWKQQGVEVDGFFQQDGSGLSRANAITPATLSGILAYMGRDSLAEVFRQSLPTADDNGILPDGSAAERIRLKSGHMTRVRAYAGYASLHGKPYAFALIINNYSCSSKDIKQKIRAFLMGLE